MKQIIAIAVLVTLASCGTMKPGTDIQEESQDQLILSTIWYQKSAEMRALSYQCFSNAKRALDENLAVSASGKPGAVVLDIDETVLDNSPFQGWQVIENKPFNNRDWGRWVSMAAAGALPGAVDFTRYAESAGVEVFYVSNRTRAELAPTLENLNALNFPDADSTHLLLKDGTSSKIDRREQIERDYDILLLIGDNLADFDGIYEGRGDDMGFKDVDVDRELFGTRYIILPNPMYGTWLSEIMRVAEGNSTREKLVKQLEGF